MRMKTKGLRSADVAAAIEILKGLIQAKYPQATFEISDAPDDPGDIDLWTIVDVEDPEEVLDLVMERLLDYQVERRIPIHVIPVRP